MVKRIALIGCGIWGLKILKELVYLKASVDVFETDHSAENDIYEAGANRVFRGIPSNNNYDGIIIATPSETHRNILEQIIPLDIPVFLEKPLTTNLDDALALERLKPDNVYLMHIWLYHPGIQLLGEIGRNGTLGKVLGIRSTRANWTSPRKDTDSAWNLLPHDITIAKEIFGFIPKPKAATAEFHDGVIRGLIALLGNNPYAVFEVSNRYESKIREVRLHCEGGIALLADEKTDHVSIIYGDANSEHDSLKTEKKGFDNTPPLRLELKEFLDYLDGGPAPRSSFTDGVEVVNTIHKLVELSRNKL